MKKTILLLALSATLPACGKREPLTPVAGQAMPARPAMAAAAPTTDQLLKPTAEARPGRSEELLRRSEERPDDRFNLPPG